jgi:circadian clock protein KaiC
MSEPSPVTTGADPQPAPKIGLGEHALDTVFGGGLPRGSLAIITGTPGAGKTIMAQQIAFAAARSGLKVIYFTNVSEPHDKLVVHMREFAFFDLSLLGSRILMFNITSQVGEGNLAEALSYIVTTVRRERADLVIVDSFRGLRHMLDTGSQARRAVFDLGAQLTMLRATCLLVGEYTPLEVQTDAEFAIADGIVQLWHAHTGVQERRALRIIKLRGVGYLGGEHSFEIGRGGIQVFPRQEALTQAPAYSATAERISMGIPELDEMMAGGLIRSSSTLLAGPAGAGKTLLALHFLAAGARAGERGLLISFQENAEQMAERASRFGLGDAVAGAGQIELLTLSPVELNVDLAAARIREAVERRGVRRVVIDSVAELEFAVHDLSRFDDYLASLVGYLRGREVTTVLTREITQLFGDELSIASRGLSYIVDNIVLVRYVELQAAVHRAIAVLKNRGSDHDKRLKELLISDGQVTIAERFAGYTRLMTGLPEPLT